jgi:hypothetical protein
MRGDQSPPALPLQTSSPPTERVDKRVDHANRLALVNKIIKAFGHIGPRPARGLRIREMS